jgi:hypothetical protein
MTQSPALDKIETMTRAIELLVHLTDKDVCSLDEALAAACALGERLEPNAIDVPSTRPYAGACAQAVCEQMTITCSNIAAISGFDPSWRAACAEFGLRSVQSAPVLGFNERALGTFVAASPRSGHSFDQDMAGFGAYAVRTIIQKQLQFR